MITLKICSVNFSNYIDLTNSVQESSVDRPVVIFDVSPNGDDYIEFETGEIFGSGGRGEHRGEDSIECQVSLYVSSEQREPLLCYREGISSDTDPLDSFLEINIPLFPTELDFIIKNIQSGIFPVTMRINWDFNIFTIDDGEGRKEPENIIDFGLEPDGSHKIWKNTKKENRYIKLTSVSFDYSPLPPQRNEESYLLETPKSQYALVIMRSVLGLIRQSIEGNFEKLHKSSKYIFILVAIVALVFYLK